MAERRFYWLKMPKTFFTSKPIKKLRSVAGGDTYTVIYLKMLLASLENDGKLYLEGFEDSAAKEIALEIDEDPENVSVTLQFLTKAKLAEIRQEEVALELSNMVGSETSSAKRVRDHRSRLALHCNDGVTNCNTEKEIETELEKSNRRVREEKEKEQEAEKEENTLLDASDLEYSFNLYLSVRREIGATVDDATISNLKKDLEKLAGGSIEKKIDILDQSTSRRWKWIFPIKENG